MRLPLDILSGMGFIGACAIVRRDNLVVGITTAATCGSSQWWAYALAATTAARLCGSGAVSPHAVAYRWSTVHSRLRGRARHGFRSAQDRTETAMTAPAGAI